jgi:hypothetical protein
MTKDRSGGSPSTVTTTPPATTTAVRAAYVPSIVRSSTRTATAQKSGADGERLEGGDTEDQSATLR